MLEAGRFLESGQFNGTPQPADGALDSPLGRLADEIMRRLNIAETPKDAGDEAIPIIPKFSARQPVDTAPAIVQVASPEDRAEIRAALGRANSRRLAELAMLDPDTSIH
ncbi:hypothetical protein HYU93_03270 [Candidatus Daviesbacteria bacterium]|nr:hypothetical protein [Candidatus Daviesbacteria bacterium]